MKQSSKVLFVDDERCPIEQLFRTFDRRCVSFERLYAQNEHDALDLQNLHKPCVAVVDLSIDPLSGPESGFLLIRRLLENDSTIRIIVLTGHGLGDYGIQAMHNGAASYVSKPADASHLAALITDGIAFSQLKREYQSLICEPPHFKEAFGLSSANKKMQKILEAAAFAASHTQPVLILGETGTGKGVLANAIHHAALDRKGNLIRFQPSFGSHDLVSSELFGHQRGAFTGATEARRGLIEEAQGGTLFVDEVGDIPLSTQVMMLDVLQEKRFRRIGSNKEIHINFRLLSATNKSIDKCLEDNLLIDDFYHRISHFRIEIPPLRERVEDIPFLAQHFVETVVNRENLPVQGISEDALGMLYGHYWPGNVRELQAVVEGGVYRAAYQSRRYVSSADVYLEKKNRRVTGKGSFRDRVKQFESKLVVEALTSSENNQSRAAAMLKLDRTSFRRILARGKL